MQAMRKLVYLVAVTADGFIATADGSFDGFLMEGPHIVDLVSDFPETFPTPVRAALGISAPHGRFDAVLMGRATYEVGALQGLTSPYAHLDQYLISTGIGRSPDPAVRLISADPVGFVRELKRSPGRDIWLCGGGQLARALYTEIDELILKLHPIVFGAGIPLFAGALPSRSLKPTERKLYDNGCFRLHYDLG